MAAGGRIRSGDMRAAGRFLILGAMPFTEVFAGIAVRDRDAAIEFGP
jgi:hypothetical protein